MSSESRAREKRHSRWPRLRALWNRLRGGRLTPWRAASSVAVGLFVGSLPLYGLHFPLCAALCLPLSLDLVTAYVAANISNPLFAPFLLTAEIQLGALVLDGHFLAFSVEQARAVGVGGFVAQAAVGSLVLGAALALVGAVVTFAVARRGGPRREARVARALQRTVARYAELPRADRVYVRIKLGTDPIAEQLVMLADSFGVVLDLATGRGQLALFLLDAGAAERVIGFDWDERKLETARRAAAGDAEMRVADLRSVELPAADTILLVDVLHYLSLDDQDALLARAAQAIPEGGRVVIREVDPGTGIRGRIAMWAERVATSTSYNRGAALAFRRPDEICSTLSRLGLEARLERDDGPLGNTLILAERRRSRTPPAPESQSPRSP